MNSRLATIGPARGFNTPLQQLLLLEERVRRVGATLPEDVDRHRRFHGIRCVMAGIGCMIDIQRVAEVIEHRHITPVPGSRPWVEGIINFRGSLVPVYNTRLFLEPGATADATVANTDGPLLVIRIGLELCAIRVNRVAGMQKCLDDDFYQRQTQTPNPRSINHYIGDAIGTDDKIWGRVDITRFMDAITGEQSALPQAAAS